MCCVGNRETDRSGSAPNRTTERQTPFSGAWQWIGNISHSRAAKIGWSATFLPRQRSIVAILTTALAYFHQGAAVAYARVDMCGKRRSKPEFGWPLVFRHLQIPRQALADRRIIPDFQMPQVTHEAAACR